MKSTMDRSWWEMFAGFTGATYSRCFAGIMKNRPWGAWISKRDMSAGMFAALAETNADCVEKQVTGPHCSEKSIGTLSVFFCP